MPTNQSTTTGGHKCPPYELMATQTRNPKYSGPPADDYAALVAILPPRPLHDAIDYHAAVDMLGNLVGFDLNADQTDYMEALATFVGQYEHEHDDTRRTGEAMSGLELLQAVMESAGLKAADLSRILGVSRSLGAMILRGERGITADHAKRLGEHFTMDPAAFIR